MNKCEVKHCGHYAVGGFCKLDNPCSARRLSAFIRDLNDAYHGDESVIFGEVLKRATDYIGGLG